jgi:M6 family metalloprotease-like protein
MYLINYKFIKFITINLLIFSVFNSFASVVVAPIEVTLTQPNGFQFKAYPKGNIYQNWLETKNKITILKNGETWYYAKLKAGELVPSNAQVGSLDNTSINLWPKQLKTKIINLKNENKNVNKTKVVSGKTVSNQAPIIKSHKQNHINLNNLSYNFNFASNVFNANTEQNILVLLVSFSDIDFTHTVSSFDSLMFGSFNSVKSYYLENSYNNFTIKKANETDSSNGGKENDGLISVKLSIPHPNSGKDFSNINESIKAAFEASDSKIDFSAFDTNNNGDISVEELSVVLIYAGYETAFGSDAALKPNIWGHKSGITKITLDSVTLSPYTAFGEQHATSIENANQASIGIMAHELGHLMLKLPDLYDYDSSSAGIGVWGLMAAGSWNGGGHSPAHLTGWSKIQSGIIEPNTVTSSLTQTSLTPADTSNSYLRVWLDKYQLEEHLILENRQQNNFDKHLPGSGLLITHINPQKTGNSDENNKLVDIEEADGLNQLDNNSSYGDDGDVYPGNSTNTVFNNTSNPNSKLTNNEESGVEINNITLNNSNVIADIKPLSKNNTGSHIRYDTSSSGISNYGNNNTSTWTAIKFTNNTSFNLIDGFEVTLNDAAEIDAYFYKSIEEGTPTNLLYSEKALAGVVNNNRFLLKQPLSIPINTDVILVLNIKNSSYGYPAVLDTGVDGKRSWWHYDGMNAFHHMNGIGEFKQHLLLGKILDTDNDGIPDETDTDDDNDGMPDIYELANNLNPLVNDANLDPDNDQLTNIQEYNNATNPQNNDTDNDGIPDGYEVNNSLNPLINDASLDFDSDGLTNIQEYSLKTSANNKDTDGDGISDGEEVELGSNPLNSSDIPSNISSWINILLNKKK